MNILKRLKLPRNSSCLIALSGGGDSVALLDMVYRLSDKYRLKISAARVIHGIRTAEEEASEAAFCGRLCRERGIPFEVLDSEAESVADIQKKYSCGTEQAARMYRHSLLNEHREAVGAEYIFFGHTADDNIETIFMRLLSGSGPEGLAGISSEKDSSLKPLILFSRSELREYLRSENISWMEDSSNAENYYRRNRLRNELLPLIKDIFPGWEKSLFTLGERSREAAAALKFSKSKQLPIVKTADECRWDVKDWDNSPEYVKALGIWEAFNYLDNSGIPDRQLSWKSLKEARALINRRMSWSAFGMRLEYFNGCIRMVGKSTADETLGRIILDRADVQDDFSEQIGGFVVKVSLKKTAGYNCIKMNEDDWPLEIFFGGGKNNTKLLKSNITVKKAANKFTDSQSDLVYIFIEEEKEGIHAGK